METAIGKWITETHELDDHTILLTLQLENDTTIGVSTQIKEIQEMMKTFTEHNHVYQLTGFDEHKYFVSVKYFVSSTNRNPTKSTNRNP